MEELKDKLILLLREYVDLIEKDRFYKYESDTYFRLGEIDTEIALTERDISTEKFRKEEWEAELKAFNERL